MKVSEFIKWLQTKPQHLEVCVVKSGYEIEGGAFGEEEVMVVQSVCFDNPHMQSRQTDQVLVLGVE